MTVDDTVFLSLMRAARLACVVGNIQVGCKVRLALWPVILSCRMDGLPLLLYIGLSFLAPLLMGFGKELSRTAYGTAGINTRARGSWMKWFLQTVH
jgi:hypothetical protein